MRNIRDKAYGNGPFCAADFSATAHSLHVLRASYPALFQVIPGGTSVGARWCTGRKRDSAVRTFAGQRIVRDKHIHFYEKTEVEFYPLGDDEIRQYIASGEPMDKAGAYGIQEKGAMFVKRINGDFYNVVGLPVARLARELNALTEK